MTILKNAADKVLIQDYTANFTSESIQTGGGDSYIVSGLSTDTIVIEQECDDNWVPVKELTVDEPGTGVYANARLRFVRSSGTNSVTLCKVEGRRA